MVSSYGAIGTEMKELNRTSWIATAYVIFSAHMPILLLVGQT